MTTTPNPTTADERLDAFVGELRRLADLIVEGAVTVPSIEPTLAWYLHGDDAQEKAEGHARALAPEWRAHPYVSSSSDYLSAVSTVGGITYDLSVRRPVVEAPPSLPPSPSVEFAAGLAATIAAAKHLELVDGDPGPDLRACCDHEAHEPNECSVPRCDCDGEGPTVVTDR